MFGLRRRRTEDDPERAADPALGVRVDLLAARLEVTEAQIAHLPNYQLEMQSLVDNATEILQRAGKARDRVRAEGQRQREKEGDGGGNGEPDYNTEEWRATLARGEHL